jgi:hypothetical protein
MKQALFILGALILTTGTVYATPIQDIQYTTSPGGESPLAGQVVTITGLVTAESYAFGGDYYFVQDAAPPWTGIRVNDPGRAVAQGDEVTLSGTVAEISGMTVIQNVTAFQILSSHNPLYSPFLVTTGSLAMEANEGCLLQVANVSVTNPSAGNGEFEVNDGSGVCRIDDAAEWYFWPELNQQIGSVVGVVDYLSGGFKLEPRLTFDITLPGRLRTLQWVQQVRQSDLIALRDSSYATGDTVEIIGIVTMPTGLSYAGAGVKFNFQDVHGGPWSSVLSYDPDSSAFPTLFEGDSVRVTGRVSEYFTSPSGMTEIFITEPIEYWIGSPSAVPPEPVVNTGDLRWPTTAEQWGTVTVKVQNCVVTANNLPFNEWKVDDGSGSVSIDDDSDSLNNFIRPPMGTSIQQIRGWVYHHYGYYTDSTTYKIEPLYLSDIVIGSGPPDVLNCTRGPGVPHEADPVEITCQIVDNSLVESAAVYYRVNGGAFQQEPLFYSNGYWSGEIPDAVQNPGNWVDYFIRAIDDSGYVGLEPPDTSFEMFCYPVTTGSVLSMQDLQATPWPSKNSPFKGYNVTVEGVVTGDTSVYSRYEAYVLQDADQPWSGTFVSWISNQLTRGQQVKVTGLVTEADPVWTYKWGGLTKIIDVDTVMITGTGTRTPLVISTGSLAQGSPSAEMYEGVLVTVNNVTVTSVNQYDWSIDDGSGACLMDDDAAAIDSTFWQSIQPYSTFNRVTGFFTYSFGTYKISLRDPDDYDGFAAVEEIQPAQAFAFKLGDNYPNPFNSATRIDYTLPTTQHVRMVVYNLMGQRVRVLVEGTQTAGKHTALWDGRDASGNPTTSGMYFYRLQAGDRIECRKMVMLK